EAIVSVADGLAVSATVNAAGDIVELIEIAEVVEVAALRSHVPKLQGNPICQLRFYVEVIGGISRGHQFLADGEDTAGRIVAENRGSRSDCRDHRRREADAVEGRPSLSGIGVVGLVAHEEVLR